MKDLFSKNYKISWRRTYLPLLIVPLILGIVLSIMVFSVTRRQLSQTGQMSVEKFRTQASSILTIKGTEATAYIYVGDRWMDPDLPRSKIIMLPISFEDGKMVLRYYDSWQIDLRRGVVRTP